MKVGDLVKVRPSRTGRLLRVGEIGVIVDFLEGSDGFKDFEVIFRDGHGWFGDLELEVLSE